MRPSCLLIPALALLAATASAQHDADSTLLDKADTLRYKSKCKEAIRIYDDLLERKAFRMEALLGRASCASDADVALKDIQEVLTAEPDNYRAHMLRSEIYQSLNMYDRAILDLDVAIEHAPDQVRRLRAMGSQGWCRINVRDLEGAIRQLSDVLAIDSVNVKAINGLAIALEESGRVDEAFTQLKRFMALDPEAIEARLNTAFFLAKHDRFEEALTYYDGAEKGRPNDPYLFNNRGYTRLRLGDVKGALKDIKRSIDMLPNNSYAYRNLGLTYQAMDKKDDACDAFERALTLGFTGQFGDEVEKIHESYCR
jgi:tetratricopeptide (TPR) repeat protein